MEALGLTLRVKPLKQPGDRRANIGETTEDRKVGYVAFGFTVETIIVVSYSSSSMRQGCPISSSIHRTIPGHRMRVEDELIGHFAVLQLVGPTERV